MVRYIITFNDGLLARNEEPMLYSVGIGKRIHKPIEWTHWLQLAVWFCSIEAAQATIDFMVNVLNYELEGKLHIREIED